MEPAEVEASACAHPAVVEAAVIAMPELPRTRSGKIMRRVARAAFLGRDPGDLSALENAGAVDAIGSAGTLRG